MYALDIETIPNLAYVDRLPEPEVKIGNLKDPAKIAEKCAEAKKEQIGNMALSPFYGRICSVAFWGEDYQGYKVVDEISDAAELELIGYAFSRMRFTDTTAPVLITWNGHFFDIPYIYKRAAILKYDISRNHVPGLSYWLKRYSHTPHCDLMCVLSNWDPKRLKLDDAASVFLGEKKLDHDFSRFVELIETGKGDEIGIYNLKDAELTYRLYEKLSPYLF